MATRNRKSQSRRAVLQSIAKKAKDPSCGGTGGFRQRDPKRENIGIIYEHRNPEEACKPFPWIQPIEHYDDEQGIDLVFRVQLTHDTFVDIELSDYDLERVVSCSVKHFARRLNRLAKLR